MICWINIKETCRLKLQIACGVSPAKRCNNPLEIRVSIILSDLSVYPGMKLGPGVRFHIRINSCSPYAM